MEYKVRKTRLYTAPFCWRPRSHITASFLYRRSPLEFIRIAGSLPRLPQRLIVRGLTRKIFATSRTVNSSGHSSPRDIRPPIYRAEYISLSFATVHLWSNKVKRDQTGALWISLGYGNNLCDVDKINTIDRIYPLVMREEDFVCEYRLCAKKSKLG